MYVKIIGNLYLDNVPTLSTITAVMSKEKNKKKIHIEAIL